uniref:Uncharacterized protein n=1 Tax=Plectus sambesii TaxID=2011161 RepID=A0A914VMJ7_9BILA
MNKEYSEYSANGSEKEEDYVSPKDKLLNGSDEYQEGNAPIQPRPYFHGSPVYNKKKKNPSNYAVAQVAAANLDESIDDTIADNDNVDCTIANNITENVTDNVNDSNVDNDNITENVNDDTA